MIAEAITTTTPIFDPRTEARRLIQLAELAQVDPALSGEVEAIARTYPGNDALHARAIRAGFLVTGEHVHAPRGVDDAGSMAHEIARVDASPDSYAEAYPVCFEPEAKPRARRWSCDCDDWRNGRARLTMSEDNPDRPKTGAPFIPDTGIVCKHILAVILYAKRAQANRREASEATPCAALTS